MSTSRSKPKASCSDADKDTSEYLSETEFGDNKEKADEKGSENDQNNCEMRIQVNPNNVAKQDTEDSRISKTSGEIHKHQKNYVNGNSEFQDNISYDLEQCDEQNKNFDKCFIMTIHGHAVPYNTDIV